MSFDRYLFYVLHGFASTFWLLDWIIMGLTRLLPYGAVLLVVFIFLRVKNWRHRIYFAAITSLAVIVSRGLVTEMIRAFYDRPRPFTALGLDPLLGTAAGGSFPSGHAVALFAVAMITFLFLRRYPTYGGWRREAVWLFAIAALTGVLRIFAGIHWPSDVLGGALIGILSAYLIWLVVPRPEPQE